MGLYVEPTVQTQQVRVKVSLAHHALAKTVNLQSSDAPRMALMFTYAQTTSRPLAQSLVGNKFVSICPTVGRLQPRSEQHAQRITQLTQNSVASMEVVTALA